MKQTIYISLIIILYIIYIYNQKSNHIYITSNLGNNYIVNKDEFQNVKVELLDKIQDNMYKLKNILVSNIDKYPDFTPYILQLKNNFTKQRTHIYETDFNSNLTSYSVNKGEELSICLRSKKNGNFHDINLLMYVVIHEMAHFACPEIGHGALFKKIFKKLIEVAIENNLYKYENYDDNPVEYCGMELKSSII
jgi:predicted metal-dependent hydrolase